MTSVDTNIDEIGAAAYCEGADARVHGRRRQLNPHPEGSNEHAYWLDGRSKARRARVAEEARIQGLTPTALNDRAGEVGRGVKGVLDEADASVRKHLN